MYIHLKVLSNLHCDIFFDHIVCCLISININFSNFLLLLIFSLIHSGQSSILCIIAYLLHVLSLVLLPRLCSILKISCALEKNMDSSVLGECLQVSAKSSITFLMFCLVALSSIGNVILKSLLF